ncbi:hypothetical protein SG34_002565 [Thalassomonas viridans]|uniref:Uncharacterized protein n=1 Tax=Thalassomonas viridans TaxID=137584 RepID=A0AAF0C9V0_9GAMM|nr:hypothetical protein [Thalassomonas viridans]WDE05836.1 hypothetical protein SG34_002565 [Thalassomonas viridans]
MDIENILDMGISIGMLLIFIWMSCVLYLKNKWLCFIEDKLEDGRRCYSLNFFLAGHGTLHYATVFLSKFHAKRYGLLEKRHRVPKDVQRLFIVVYCLFITGSILCLGFAGILSVLQAS